VGFQGRGTLAPTLRGIDCLRAAGIEPALISVCSPSTDPERVLTYIVEDLGIKQFNIFPPDATHSDNPPSIADYFIKLFDVWFDRYADQGVRISTLDARIRSLTGNLSVAKPSSRTFRTILSGGKHSMSSMNLSEVPEINTREEHRRHLETEPGPQWSDYDAQPACLQMKQKLDFTVFFLRTTF
jgi:hypothetical protein